MNCGYSKKFGTYTLLFVLFCTNQYGYAQKIENINYLVVENTIHLNYDLIYEIDNAEFNISVYYGDQKSQTRALTNATGEIGDKAIFPGRGKKIIIEDILPFDPFMGNLKFRIVHKLMYVPVHNFEVLGNKFKRGKSVPIAWQGGKSGEIVQLTLLKSDEEVYTRDHKIFAFFIAGSRETNFIINKNVKRGDDYKIQLTTVDNISFTSSVFSVKPKIPMAVKIGGFVIVGGLVAILSGISDSGGGDSNQRTSVPDLPDGAHPGGG